MIETLVRTLGIYRKAAIQAPIMETLLHLLVASEEEAAKAMVSGSVVEACATSLKAFGVANEVVVPCVEVLIRLSHYKAAESHLLSVPIVPDLISVIGKEGQEERIQTRCMELLSIPVSYTHLTLPTILRV